MFLGLEQKATQNLTITPQMQQALRVLQYSTLELIQEINEMLEQNPFLESEDTTLVKESSTVSDSGTDSFQELTSPGAHKDNFSEDESIIDLKADHESLRNHLLRQLGCLPLTDHDRALVEWLIGSLNDQGMLEESLEEIAAVAPFEEDREPEDWNYALKLLQSFEPTGVGARNIQELLLLQLNSPKYTAVNPEVVSLAKEIIEKHLDLLGRKNFLLLKKELHCRDQALKNAVDLIASLDPHPVSNWSEETIKYVIPEISVVQKDGIWVAQLLESSLPSLKINALYAEAIRNTKSDDDHKVWQGRLSEANFFLKNLNQRKQTILEVSSAIVRHQQEFFTHGPTHMKPLVLRNIAEELGLHESTISRVTHGKYLSSPRGIFELKFFFSSSLPAMDGNLSSRAIKAELQHLIDTENPKKPYSDAKLVELLKEKNIDVARRTISKYREQLGIGSASQRKVL